MWVPAAEMVGLGRFELPTSPLSGVRYNQLSYRPDAGELKLAGSPAGFAKHSQEPGGSHKTSFNVKKGFRGQG